LKNRHPRLEVGGLDIRNQTHLKPRNQPLLQAWDLAGRAITGNHDLPASFMQSVKRVKELLLGVFLPFNELNIVNQN
jgi:hypothetical protein